MSTSNIGWIVILVAVAVVVIAALVVVITRTRNHRRQRQAEKIREEARLETVKVERREALAEETAAKARAAAAEAEAKAAEAARLQSRAAGHQSEAATSREQLQEQLHHADRIDPKNGKRSRDRDAVDTDEQSAARRDDAAFSEEMHEPATDNYRDAGTYRGAST